MSEVINIYTHGACKNSPGPGGWAAVILTPHGKNLTVRGRYPTSTNDRMKLTAAVKGLQELRRLNHLISKPLDLPVILHSDSKYLTDAFNENWLPKWKKNGWNTSMGTPVSNPDLWRKLLLLAEQRNITWQRVKDQTGNTGNYFNDLCDQIATEEAQMANEEAETGCLLAARQPAARPHETPDDFQTDSGYELEPVQIGSMEILDFIFAVVNEASSFNDFKARMVQQPSTRPHETPDDFQTGSGYKLEPVQVEPMKVLELIFAAVNETSSFKNFKARMDQLEESIDWELPHWNAQAQALE